MELLLAIVLLIILGMFIFQGGKYAIFQLPKKIKTFLSKPKNLFVCFIIILLLLAIFNPNRNGELIIPILLLVALVVFLRQDKWL